MSKPVSSKESTASGQTYRSSGVDTSSADRALDALLAPLSALSRRPGLRSLFPTKGYFANVLDIGSGQGLAITTDGVGSKILVAEMAGKFDTIGIDCVAMNVNDLLCVGARPLAFVDYLAVERTDPVVFGEIGEGLRRGVEEAEVELPGGEVAVLPEMIRGHHPGSGFDLVGTAVGLVPLGEVIVGKNLIAGDLVIGLASSGLHSNGYSLARGILLSHGRLGLEDFVPSLGCTLGEELLRPTRIYVKSILALLDAQIHIKAVAHITGDGLLNLGRVASDVSFRLDAVPDPHPIFQLIQEMGGIDDAEMHTVFNMGIGFCLTVPRDQADNALQVLVAQGEEPSILGEVVDRSGRVVEIPQRKLTGRDKGFSSTSG